MAGLRYVGDRPMGASRALPWIAPALPPAAGLLNARIGAAHALGSHGADRQRRIANASPDRITATAGVRSGLVDQAGTAEAERQADPLGEPSEVRPLLANRRGSEARPGRTGRNVSRKYESQLEKRCEFRVEHALERTVDPTTARAAFQQFEDGVAGRRARNHPPPPMVAPPLPPTALYLEILSDAFAAGRLPRMNMADDGRRSRRPAWRGPKRQPPQPEKEAQSLALLAREGIITADDARDQLET